MAISGWCGQRGTPNHDGCLAPMCSCWCHTDTALDLLTVKTETVTLTTDVL